MPSKFYRLSDLAGTRKSRTNGDRGILGLSPATVLRMVRAGQFPAPIKLLPSVTAWPSAPVDAWIAERSGSRNHQGAA